MLLLLYLCGIAAEIKMVGTFTQPQCSLKVWKMYKSSVFRFVTSEWVSEWVKGRQEGCEVQPLPAAVAQRGGSRGRSHWRRGVSSLRCSASVVGFQREESRGETGAAWLEHRRNQIVALHAQEFRETWLRRKILAAGGEVSESMAGEWRRDAVLSFATGFELRHKANVLNEKNW